MQDLKEQLIRLGNTNPELRPHLRKILDKVAAETPWKKKDLVEALAMAVQNDHSEHWDDPKRGVDVAIKAMVKQFEKDLNSVKRDAVKFIEEVADGKHTL